MTESSDLDPSEMAQQMQADLAAIERTHMPFGKYGPAAFPPAGVPLYDLPAEYLAWFAQSRQGWPKGKIGQLMKMVYHMKADGSDMVFDPMRRRAGGRVELRAKRQRSFDFKDSATPPLQE